MHFHYRTTSYLIVLIILCNFPQFKLEKNCLIEFYIKNDKLNMNYDADLIANNELKIYSNTIYNVLCRTTEKVRSINKIILTWPNDNKNSIVIANETERSDKYSYLTGDLKLNPTDVMNNKNYTLFCRFVTYNTSVYCEKEIKFIVNNVSINKYFISVSIIIILIVVLNIAFKYFIKHRKNQSSNFKDTDSHYWDRVSRF